MNPNATDARYYGAKGITVDPRWFRYDEFLADMGQRPENTTLERNDNKLSYTKNNCNWATRLQQARNREYTLDLIFEGKTLKVWEWAEQLRVKPKIIHHRLWRLNSGLIEYHQIFKGNERI